MSTLSGCPNLRCVDGRVPGGPMGDLLCPDCKGAPCALHAVHRTLFTTVDVALRMAPYGAHHVAIVYWTAEEVPEVGDVVNTSRPGRDILYPEDVKVVEVIEGGRVRGIEGAFTMPVNIVVGAILAPGVL